MTNPFHLMTIEELESLPEPVWLIHGLFEVGDVICVYGDPAVGKTFLALDWALSISAGARWLDRPVSRGPVVYVAAEGARNIGRRIAAWRQEHSEVPNTFRLVAEPVNLLLEEQVTALASAIEAASIAPTLIVFDTLARCFVGGDENSSKEMGQAIDNLRLLKKVDTTILLVHHSAKNAKMERGSGALRAAIETMFRVHRSGSSLRIETEKQKDNPEAGPIHFKLTSVDLPTGSSAVVRPTATPVEQFASGSGLANTHRILLEQLSQLEQPAKSGAWCQASQLKERTFDRYRERLLDKGYVETQGRSGYSLTEKGRHATSPPMSRLAA